MMLRKRMRLTEIKDANVCTSLLPTPLHAPAWPTQSQHSPLGHIQTYARAYAFIFFSLLPLVTAIAQLALMHAWLEHLSRFISMYRLHFDATLLTILVGAHCNFALVCMRALTGREVDKRSNRIDIWFIYTVLVCLIGIDGRLPSTNRSHSLLATILLPIYLFTIIINQMCGTLVLANACAYYITHAHAYIHINHRGENRTHHHRVHSTPHQHGWGGIHYNREENQEHSRQCRRDQIPLHP